MAGARFDRVIALIDEANARDPGRASDGGVERPAALVYSRRMTRMLDRLHPDAGEHLRIAVRAQHIERWTVSRASYPKGRVGYLRWRKDLMHYHARRAGELMEQAGYGADDIARVQAIVRKERLKSDAESQALEDVACLVFLEGYFADFAPRYDEAKVVDILRKTWAKMSPAGQRAALALELPGPARRLVESALEAVRE